MSTAVDSYPGFWPRPDFDPTRVKPRANRAWINAILLLADGEWHAWNDVIAVMTSAPLSLNWAQNLLYSGISSGVLFRRGQYTRAKNYRRKPPRPFSDTREVRLHRASDDQTPRTTDGRNEP